MIRSESDLKSTKCSLVDEEGRKQNKPHFSKISQKKELTRWKAN